MDQQEISLHYDVPGDGDDLDSVSPRFLNNGWDNYNDEDEDDYSIYCPGNNAFAEEDLLVSEAISMSVFLLQAPESRRVSGLRDVGQLEPVTEVSDECSSVTPSPHPHGPSRKGSEDSGKDAEVEN